MGWKSVNMCAEYISNSKQALNEVGSMLAESSSSQPRPALTPPNNKATPTNVIAGPSGEAVITRKEKNVDDDIVGEKFDNDILQILMKDFSSPRTLETNAAQLSRNSNRSTPNREY